MKRLIFATIAACFGMVLLYRPAVASDKKLSGWHDIPFGVSVEEFQIKHPCTVNRISTSFFTCSSKDQIKIGGLSSSLTAYFVDGKLVKFHLQAPLEEDNQSFDYSSWLEDLTMKYGPPNILAGPLTLPGKSYMSLWRFAEGTSIALEFDGFASIDYINDARYLPSL